MENTLQLVRSQNPGIQSSMSGKLLEESGENEVTETKQQQMRGLQELRVMNERDLKELNNGNQDLES